MGVFSAQNTRRGELGAESMLDNLRLFFGVISFLIGMVLLYDSARNPDANQTTMLVGGALLVSLGLFCVWIVAKNWLELRKYFKNEGR
jgi:uncharacterized membrane protein